MKLDRCVLPFLGLVLICIPNLAVSDEGVLPSPGEKDTDSAPFVFHLIPPAAQGIADLTATENTWARFAPRSWVRFQTTVVSGSDAEPIRSVTEVKQILENIDKKTYTLRRCVSVQTGAQELVRNPKLITYNFYDRAAESGLTSVPGPCDNITINVSLKKPDNPIFQDMGRITRTVPCYVRIFNKRIENRREETKIWYSPVIFPHLLRQESRIFVLPEDENDQETLYRSSTKEIWKNSVDLRFGLVKDWMTLMTETDANGQVRSQVTTLHSSQIPGGVLSETAIEYDADGVQVLRSDSRLLDYYAAPR